MFKNYKFELAKHKFPEQGHLCQKELVMTLLRFAEDKIQKKYSRRRLKHIQLLKEHINPKIEHNIKCIYLDNGIQNIVGQFETNKFSKILSKDREILDKYKRQAIKVQKIKLGDKKKEQQGFAQKLQKKVT